MQASRLLSIMMLLQARGRMSATALAQALEVSVRTILRDVDELSAHTLQEVASAVWRSVRIHIQYESWRGNSQREIEPWGLILKAGAWYLVAKPVGKAEALTFRLANIQTVRSTQRHFKRPSRFDLAAHWQASTQRFEAELYKLSAQIIASPRAQAWLANGRIKAIALPHDLLAGHLPEGWGPFVLPIESVAHGVRQLLGFGAEVKVLQPQALQDALLEEFQRLCALYAIA